MTLADRTVEFAATVEEFAASLAMEAPSAAKYHRSMLLLFGFAELAARMELAGWTPESIREALAGPRAAMGRSAFIRRLQEWPRGYPGDFETIELLLGNARSTTSDPVGQAFERAALDTAVAQQHRFKVLAQARAIEACLTARGSAARILCLASGSVADLRLVNWEAVGLPGRLVLSDLDGDALDYSATILNGQGVIFERRKGHVLQALRRPNETFDLIVAGGLFDYLDDRVATLVIRQAMTRLDNGGLFFFTNIRTGNPYRAWMEHAADWRLHERSEQAVRRLIELAGCPNDAVTIVADGTGLALLVTCARTSRHQIAVAIHPESSRPRADAAPAAALCVSADEFDIHGG